MPEIKPQVDRRPKVGVGVMIIKDGKTLLGRRLGSHGAGEYAFPGGHLEYMESFEDCARREVREETGLEIDNVQFLFLSNVKRYRPKHYVHVGLVADWLAGDPTVEEPDRCAGWDWYDLNRLPEPIFFMCQQSIEAYRSGEMYFDAVK